MNGSNFFVALLAFNSFILCMELPPNTSLAISNNTFKKCQSFERVALELDAVYLLTKNLIDADDLKVKPNNLEAAYIKAIKCFLEEYEKNNKEAIIPVIKMWHLLMQVEHEKKEIDKNYLMPAEVKQIADKVKEILNLYQTKKKPRPPQEIKTPLSPKHSLQKLFQLKIAIDELSIPQLVQEEISGSKIKNLNCRQGHLLYNQAKRELSIDQMQPDPDKLFIHAETNFTQALKFFIAAYNENYFPAFYEIQKTVKNILDLEQVRQVIEDTDYTIHSDYISLQEALNQVKDAEEQRFNFKILDNAEKILAHARAQKDSLKDFSKEITDRKYEEIETSYLQATHLFFKAHEQRKENALNLANNTLDECLKFDRSRKSGSKVYFPSAQMSTALDQLKKYQAESKKIRP